MARSSLVCADVLLRNPRSLTVYNMVHMAGLYTVVHRVFDTISQVILSIVYRIYSMRTYTQLLL